MARIHSSYFQRLQPFQSAFINGFEYFPPYIAEQMPKCIRAVTPRGFELKVCLFLLAFAICG